MTMNRRSVYIVVNEGASERTYLQSLRSFLANRMPLGDDFCPRLDLIPRVTNGGMAVRRRPCKTKDRVHDVGGGLVVATAATGMFPIVVMVAA